MFATVVREMNIMSLVVIFALWLVLVASGYVYFRIARLDPHNPARLPGRWSRLFSAGVAATALLASAFLAGPVQLFFAALAVGTVLGPGLNDPYYLRRDEESSWLSRTLATARHGTSGGWLLKIVASAIGFVSSFLWPSSWLAILTFLAAMSIGARALVLWRSDDKDIERNLKEAFGSDLPPDLSTLDPETAKFIRESSDRAILAGLPSPLGRTLVASKRVERLRNWHERRFVMPRLLTAWLGLIVWIAIASSIFLSDGTVGINSGNFNGAYGMIVGIALSIVLHRFAP
ncbi:membrane hypothetical protein [Agrobacterium fabrum str. J-07]|uniref:hypothetical protein n=1 Tax=Agrobacterium fabrum TaxID=1176649 RepID=UPI0009BBBBE0|nr:hypothetical protein [Agrobacterium fabrum]CUX57040.1 membrane hypothetical protein [Agrobacterium fabrum str. J-07]